MINTEQYPSKVSQQKNYLIGYQQQMQKRSNEILSKYYGPNSRIWHMITQNINENKQIIVYQNQTQQTRKQQIQQNKQIGDPKTQHIQYLKITQMISYLQQTGLKLKYDQTNYNDVQQLYVLLKYYLQYPIQRLANKHIRANSFNRFDISTTQQYQPAYQKLNQNQSLAPNLLQTLPSNQNQNTQIIYIPQICECCSLPVPQRILSQQPTPLWIFSDLKHIGISTRLFFQTQLVLGLMLLIMFVVFCLYAIITNFKATISYLSQLSLYDQTLQFFKQITYQGISAYSPGSLMDNQTKENRNRYQSQKILGYLTLLLLIIIFLLSKLWERKQMKLTPEKYARAETFTLLFNNFPAYMTVQHLQNLLTQYFHKVLQHEKDNINTIKQQVHRLKQAQLIKFNQAFEQLKNDKNIGNMAYINVFYKINSKWKQNYEKYLQRNLNLGIIQKINKASLLFQKPEQKIQEIIKSETNIFELRRYFQKLIKNRQKSYTFDQLYTDEQYRYTKYEQYRKQRKRLQQLKINKNDQILKQRQIQLDTMPTFVTFTNRYFFQKLLIHHKKQPFKYTINENKSVKANIQQSPSPQDIIWSNIGQSPVSLTIKFIINLIITFLISIVSLIILYLLTLQKQDFQNMADNWYYVSYLMIPIIIGFKYLIRRIVYKLTKRQFCWTNSHQQASIVFKANLILIFQSTFVPSAISSIGTANLLGQRGLSQITFYLSFLNVVDPFSTIYKIYRYMRPYNRIEYSQALYNQVRLDLEKKDYQISNQYLQVVDTFVFTCAFAPFQPWVVLPGIVHFWFLIMYRKYYLITYCKRPIPDSKIIQDAAMIFIIMGPAEFIFMAEVIDKKSNYQFSSVPSILLIIGFFILFFFFFGLCTITFFRQTQGADQIYYQHYVNQITIDYDMKNPSTAANRVQKSRRNYISNLGKINNILI